MTRIQIENGYVLCVMQRQAYTHLLLEQTLPDGSVVLHGEKKLSKEDLLTFFASSGANVEGIKATFFNQPEISAKKDA
jgi:hypothetical protein